jgi:hypothetical protein
MGLTLGAIRNTLEEHIENLGNNWKISKKKLYRRISRRGKKKVLKSPHFEEKKNRF